MSTKICIKSQIFLLTRVRQETAQWRLVERRRLKMAVTDLLADYFLADVRGES